MTCGDFEILLCDYLDGTLDPEQRRSVEGHRDGCPACAEFARDVAGATAFIGRAAVVEPPPELLTKITFQIPSGTLRPIRGFRSWVRSWLQPLLQPRFAMGMAMTILSFSMLGRLAGVEPRQLQPSDLHPVAVWQALDNRAYRMWERAVKYYENLRLVYEVQTRLQDWTEQDEQNRRTAAEEAQRPSSIEGKKK